jgi:hypothetical protein
LPEDLPALPAAITASTAQLRAELLALGASPPPEATPAELEAQLRSRLAMIEGLDRGALLDLAAWYGLEPSESAGANSNIARNIQGREPGKIEELSLRGLRALAWLRDLPRPAETAREELERALRPEEGFWAQIRRHRRKIVGSLLEKALAGESAGRKPSSGAPPAEETIRQRIERRGVVAGISQTLRGAADDYIAEKLDEIEQRIDQKLNEIEARLEEWRDREIANRLRLLKITLIFAIVVALLSVGYDVVRLRIAANRPAVTMPAPAPASEQAPP